MLKLSPATMHNMGRAKVSRGRSRGPDRGAIRKRGGNRVDRDGDFDMDRNVDRGRGGKRARGHSGRGNLTITSTQGRDQRKMSIDRDRTRNTIQKALSDSTSQANFGRPAVNSGILQASIRGWRQSKAASNSDGGIQSLVTFLEKKITPPDSKASANPRTKITKVCAIMEFVAVTGIYSQHRPLHCVLVRTGSS